MKMIFEEVAALAAISLFIATVAVWAAILGVHLP
jgi:hypothetical protein